MIISATIIAILVPGIRELYKERIVEWLGEDFNPELFVVDWVNARLKGKRPIPIWTPAQKSTEKKRKIGRNEPCPCGSGKKYKKCCLDKDTG